MVSNVFHTILYHATENTVGSTINAKLNGKVEYNTIEYKTAFLFSPNWQYSLQHGINNKYIQYIHSCVLIKVFAVF